MWQSILFSNNDNILSAVRTQSGESGNTLKSQVEVLRQTREQTSFRAYNVRSRVQ